MSAFLISEVTEGAELATGAEPEDWMWLLDLERAVALAIGRCLGGMLQGPPPSIQEKTAELWLCNPLLRNGLEMDFEQLGRVGPVYTHTGQWSPQLARCQLECPKTFTKTLGTK